MIPNLGVNRKGEKLKGNVGEVTFKICLVILIESKRSGTFRDIEAVCLRHIST